MAKKLLIDANHPEEARVAVINGTILEDFDSETSTKRQIKGNIYLAKVVRIEPSLQAAFIEFGENRHGFLPFSEIHPDYYRIPVADRKKDNEQSSEDDNTFSEESLQDITVSQDTDKDAFIEQPLAKENNLELLNGPENSQEENIQEIEPEILEQIPEESFKRSKQSYRYKIQEVIKRRQIILVQIVKEERGNKGAALTTYLSLPGRYCVLMPNAGHRGGGVSRKINDGEDRRRLKDLVKEFEIPEGIGLIVRTAGQERNKIEIRRDYDYLMRLWTDIRQLTLESIAPTLVYAEGDLIKKAIRDIYTKDIDQILIEGEEAYKNAKTFMRTLIPSHVRKVQLYKDPNVPLFHRYYVEEQIEKMMYPSVQLTSGGSIVINTTEALVAIDVNSGKSTRERHIEETALKTNLEAADEIARQMRLRDLAGLVVVDFIDMEDNNHIQQVEKRLKDATKNDRARLQIGKISQFGLLELSRQRLRPSLIETHSIICSHCHGAGIIRSTESMALHILRAIETKVIQERIQELLVTVPNGIELYLLNQKRSAIISIETRFNISIQINRDISLNIPDFRIDILKEKDSSVEEKSSYKAPLEKGKTIEEKEIEQTSLKKAEPTLNKQRSHHNSKRRPPTSQETTDNSVKANLDSNQEPAALTAQEIFIVKDTQSVSNENLSAVEQEKKPFIHKRRSKHRSIYKKGRNFYQKREKDKSVSEESSNNITENILKSKNSNKQKPNNNSQESSIKDNDNEQKPHPKKRKNWLRRLLE